MIVEPLKDASEFTKDFPQLWIKIPDSNVAKTLAELPLGWVVGKDIGPRQLTVIGNFKSMMNLKHIREQRVISVPFVR